MSMENTTEPPVNGFEPTKARNLAVVTDLKAILDSESTDIFKLQKQSINSGGKYETPSYGTKVELIQQLSHRSNNGQDNAPAPKVCFNIDTMLHLVKEQGWTSSKAGATNSLTTLSD